MVLSFYQSIRVFQIRCGNFGSNEVFYMPHFQNKVIQLSDCVGMNHKFTVKKNYSFH